MGMPECKIPFALTGKDISSKQQLLEPSFVFRSQLGVKSSDDLVYTQQLLILKVLIRASAPAHKYSGQIYTLEYLL